jgi:hypothetical protein
MIDLFNSLLGSDIRPELEWVVELIAIVFVMVIIVQIFQLIMPWRR